MALVHEFGIIQQIDQHKRYVDYAPEQYQCIAVEDEVIERMFDSIAHLQTYHISLNQPAIGLAYYGITLIPPQSLTEFLHKVLSEKVNADLSELAEKIIQAQTENKYMIHFGI